MVITHSQAAHADRFVYVQEPDEAVRLPQRPLLLTYNSAEKSSRGESDSSRQPAMNPESVCD